MKETTKFSERTAVPPCPVSEVFGNRFNRCADLIGVPNPTVLLPAGGAPLNSKMRLVDLAGLCDRTIAIALENDRQPFYECVFEETKPTFIHVHSWWTSFVQLESDPRLARDYVLIHRLNDPEVDWLDYVRRDAIGQRTELLHALDAEIRVRDRGIARPNLWPAAASPSAITDPATEARILELMARMSVEEKVGQTIMTEIGCITPQDLCEYPLGALFVGGDSAPLGNPRTLPADWFALIESFRAANAEARPGDKAIPLLFGIDAVHGNNKILGATVFPHNIGLGAAGDPDLVRRIGEVTAQEVLVIGADWTFAPVLAVPRDLHWGRTYEGYSEDPAVVASFAGPITLGLQGELVAHQPIAAGHIVATAKHFLGDGGTKGGVDGGDADLSETELIRSHAHGYPPAIEAGVLTVMVALSSWNGIKHTGNASLLTEVLKGRMGFEGFVVGDWNGHAQIPGCTGADCPEALKAGLDMYMAPDGWKELFANTVAQVKSGRIPTARLDDAVRRILRVKSKAGVFDGPSPMASQFHLMGSAANRAVAREAVRKSLVMLKNKGGVLPIKPSAHVLVAGDGAENIAQQCGGWTLGWQGVGNKNSDFPHGQSIYAGIAEVMGGGSGQVELAIDGNYKSRPDVAIVVFGEDPYAEFQGDLKTLEYQRDDKRALALLKKLRARRIPVVSVFLSGRPLRTTREIAASDAFIVAWLPGTEGGGVADVLFASLDGSPRYEFQGRLPFSWPKRSSQTPGHLDEPGYDPQFAYSYGLTYARGRRHPAAIGRGQA